MLGGLIAGALGGGAQAVSGIADQVIKEAQLAKQQAYEKGLLQWKLDEGRKDAETEREFRVANTVLDNQLRGEQQTKEFEFRAQQQKEQIAAQERQLQQQLAAQAANARRSAGAGRQMSPAQEREYNLMLRRDAAIEAGDTETVKKIDQMIGTKGEKPSLTVLGEDPSSGAKQYGILDSSGSIVRVPVRDPFAPANSAPQGGGFDLAKAQREALASSGNGSSTPVRTQPATVSPQQSYQRPPDGSNRNDVNKAYNTGIQNALNLKSQQIVAAERKGDVQSVMKLTQEYQQLQKSMR